MSLFHTWIVVIAGVFVLGTLVLLGYAVTLWSRSYRLLDSMVDLRRSQPEPEPEPDLAPEPDDAVTPVPIPVHPTKPPQWRVYQPVTGATSRWCDCHGEPLAAGQPVLWWTRPDESVLLFCERTFPRQEAGV